MLSEKEKKELKLLRENDKLKNVILDCISWNEDNPVIDKELMNKMKESIKYKVSKDSKEELEIQRLILKDIKENVESIGFKPSIGRGLKLSINSISEAILALESKNLIYKVVVPVVTQIGLESTHEDLWSRDLNMTPSDFEISNDIDFEPIDSTYIEVHIAYKFNEDI